MSISKYSDVSSKKIDLGVSHWMADLNINHLEKQDSKQAEPKKIHRLVPEKMEALKLIEKEGFLKKKGLISSKKRWFVLNGVKRSLMYFKDRSKKRFRGQLLLDDITYIKHTKRNKILIQAKNKSFYLIARGSEDAGLWEYKIKQIMDYKDCKVKTPLENSNEIAIRESQHQMIDEFDVKDDISSDYEENVKKKSEGMKKGNDSKMENEKTHKYYIKHSPPPEYFFGDGCIELKDFEPGVGLDETVSLDSE